jgi:hypothetical protein
MAVTGRVGGLAVAALLAAAGAGCAPAFTHEYGEPALTVIQFPVLDSALAPHAGAAVTVWAQPTRIDPEALLAPAMVSFTGHLAGLHSGWVHVLQNGGDTVRIGKDYVRRVRLDRATQRNRWIGGLVGAVGFGLAGWVYTRSSSSGTTGEEFAIIGGSVVAGAGLGILIIPSSRTGEQIFPVLPRRPRVNP